MKKKIKCPQCKRDTEYSPENPFRPFCSNRCKLIDLGEWAEEKYAIPSEDSQSSPDEEAPDPDNLH